MALYGKTPSEACGITIEGKNKWKKLIENASQNKKKVKKLNLLLFYMLIFTVFFIFFLSFKN